MYDFTGQKSQASYVKNGQFITKINIVSSFTHKQAIRMSFFKQRRNFKER